MISPGQLLRLFYINLILVRHGLDEIIFIIPVFRPFRFVLRLLPWHWFPKARGPLGVRLRLALEDLGPIFVKFGQTLSTRRDLLPTDVAQELARLQDRVPPFPGDTARRIVEKAYGKSIEAVFECFEDKPLASASIAQVHAARLHDGSDVIVKVVRPNIERTIRVDVALLYILAELAERYWPDGRRLRLREVVAEYEKTIIDELDLMREAASASQLRRNFLGSELLYIPEVYWPYTVRNVMVMERISGTPISDIDGLKRQGIDLKKLSERGVEIFFTQVFRDNFFHADMHPGNIFVSPEGRYLAVDFGIMGSLSPQDQRYLADNFLAFFKRDYQRVAELHVESGWVPAGTRINEFESAIRTVCEPIFERPLKDISFGQLLMRLFQTARRFNMEVQPQLVLLQKTLLNIEGLGRELDPELDLWQTAKPFLEGWMKDQVGPRALFRNLQSNAPMWIERMPDIPELVYDALQLARQERIHGMPKSDELNRQLREIRRGVHRAYAAVIGGALIISAVLLLVIPAEGLTTVAGAPLWSWIFGLVGAAIILYFWPRERAG